MTAMTSGENLHYVIKTFNCFEDPWVSGIQSMLERKKDKTFYEELQNFFIRQFWS